MDDGLKQRLIGALVLIAIAVIFLPSLFSGEHGRRLDTRTQIPPAPETKVVVIEQPKPIADMPKAPKPEAMYQLLEEDDATPVKSAKKTAEAKSDPAVLSEKPKSDKQPVADAPKAVPVAPALDARKIPKAWAIQVASYNTEARANSLVNQLIGDGYKAFLHPAVIGKGKVYRVLVGPKIDRGDALKVKAELDKQLKVSAILVKFQP